MRVNYKSFPFHNTGLPEVTKVWRPVLLIKIIYGHTTSKRFEAFVDTGTDFCLFPALVGANIGIKIDNGPMGKLGGIIAGHSTNVYFHNIKLVIGADIIQIKAGFSWDITSSLLGQTGFFDNFAVSFHPVFDPPCFDVDRVQRH